jgi:macrolide transport system ATP-binding/permease protein
MMDTLRQDLRFALRQLIRSPGFAVLAVAMLGLGIGATTTIFSVINTIFLRPPAHVREPERLVAIFTSDFSGPRFGTSSYPDFVDFAAGVAGLEGLAATTPRPFSVTTGNESFRAFGEMVSDEFFGLLGVPLVLGPGFTPGSSETDAVIGYGLWQRRLGGAADVVGRTIRLSGHTFTIAGVAPEGFNGTMRGVRVEIWTPLGAQRVLSPGDDMFANRGDRGLFLVGRLRGGVTPAEAQSQLDVVAARLHRAYDRVWTDRTGGARVVTLLPERDARIFPTIRGPVTQFLALLMGVACLVLAICCANLANLLLARGTARRREVAVRLALGGSRARVVRQLLTEGLVLAAAGAAAGVVLATWATGALASFEPPLPVPVALEFPLDARLILFTVLVTAVTVVLSALAPALRATRLEGATALRGDMGATGVGRRVGLRDGLVVAQVAVSLVVLAAAGLFLASLRNATHIDPGFHAAGLSLVRLELGIQGYDSVRGKSFYAELERRVRSLPDVEAVSLAEIVPLGLARQRRHVEIEGYTPREGEEMEFGVNTVGAGYFETMVIDLARGRGFEPSDREGTAPVAVVNESFARRFWPGEDPIGRRFRAGRGGTREVVGVARDGKYWSLTEDPQPHYYEPFAQAYEADMVLLVRSGSDPRSILPALAREARALDPELPVDVNTMAEHLGFALLPQRIGAAVLGVFGGLAALLAAFGLYGVMSYVVSRRTAEIGIRMALGARARDVRMLVVRRALALTLAGLGLGLAGALAATRVLAAFLVDVSPTDPATLGSVAVLFTAVALLASWLPARRAAAVDPMRALRSE